MSKKRKRKRQRKRNEQIPAPRPADVDGKLLRFSFKYLDFGNANFIPSDCSHEYFCHLFRILNTLSDWRVGDFVDPHNNQHRHLIDFDNSTETNGFQLPEGDQMGYVEGWQFSVQPDVPHYQGRVHGALVDEVFFIVWLDEHHRLC